MKRMAVPHLLLAITLVSALPSVLAAEWWLTGNLTNVTSDTGGLLVMIDSGVPGNCAGTPYGWMRIPEVNKTMVATVLMTWATGNRSATVYTSPPSGGGQYCVINQFDPH